MKIIKVLGPGCPKCKNLYNNVTEAVKESDIQADIEKIETIEKMIEYNIFTTPALLIDGEVKIKGRVASIEEIKEILSDQH